MLLIYAAILTPTLIGVRGKIEDIIYQLYPTPEFTREVKAANKRQKDLEPRR